MVDLVVVIVFYIGIEHLHILTALLQLFWDFFIDVVCLSSKYWSLVRLEWGVSYTHREVTRLVCVVESQIVLRGTDNCDPFRECATTNWPTMVSRDIPRSRNSSFWKEAPGGRLCWNIMIGEAISGGKCSRRKTERDKDTKGALAVWINPTYVVMVISCTEKCDCIILQKKPVSFAVNTALLTSEIFSDNFNCQDADRRKRKDGMLEWSDLEKLMDNMG